MTSEHYKSDTKMSLMPLYVGSIVGYKILNSLKVDFFCFSLFLRTMNVHVSLFDQLEISWHCQETVSNIMTDSWTLCTCKWVSSCVNVHSCTDSRSELHHQQKMAVLISGLIWLLFRIILGMGNSAATFL